LAAEVEQKQFGEIADADGAVDALGIVGIGLAGGQPFPASAEGSGTPCRP
jgi:hypothetical protein